MNYYDELLGLVLIERRKVQEMKTTWKHDAMVVAHLCDVEDSWAQLERRLERVIAMISPSETPEGVNRKDKA